jgi:predicted nucleotidyltransferase
MSQHKKEGYFYMKNVEKIIYEFKNEIKQIVKNNLKQIILFGSFARGDAVEGSDVDLLLIFNTEPSSDIIQKIRELSSSLSLKYDVVISEVLLTEEQFEKYKTPFLMNVKKEGIVI